MRNAQSSVGSSRADKVAPTGADETLIRNASAADLAAVNAVVAAGVMSWRLPERVKRLSLASYRYNELDLLHLDLVLAERAGGGVAGVAAWEQADAEDLPAGKTGLLLHGLYVAPDSQGRGVGKHLLDAAFHAVAATGTQGLLVKAQVDAAAYFARHGFDKLPVMDPGTDYPHRFWRPVSA